MPKRYNTPHRSRVVKTRLSEDEYADFTARLAPYGISQSEFLRQAIRRTAIRPIIHVSEMCIRDSSWHLWTLLQIPYSVDNRRR